MDKEISEIVGMAIGLCVVAVITIICVAFTNEAKSVQIKNDDLKALHTEMRDEREWRKYEGKVTGADVVDFIVRHKDVCDIVIIDAKLALNGKFNTYLTGGKLILGLRDIKNIPDDFWEITFIYDNVIGGLGDLTYTAALLYDGQLEPEYENGKQVRGGIITGIEYRIL